MSPASWWLHEIRQGVRLAEWSREGNGRGDMSGIESTAGQTIATIKSLNCTRTHRGEAQTSMNFCVTLNWQFLERTSWLITVQFAELHGQVQVQLLEFYIDAVLENVFATLALSACSFNTWLKRKSFHVKSSCVGTENLEVVILRARVETCGATEEVDDDGSRSFFIFSHSRRAREFRHFLSLMTGKTHSELILECGGDVDCASDSFAEMLITVP